MIGLEKEILWLVIRTRQTDFSGKVSTLPHRCNKLNNPNYVKMLESHEVPKLTYKRVAINIFSSLFHAT